MKKECKLLFLIAAGLAVFNMLLFFAIRPMWSGVILYTGHATPYIVMAVMVLLSTAAAIMIYYKRYPLAPGIALSVISAFFLGVEVYIISLTTEAYHYFIREFLIGLGFLLLLVAVAWVIFGFPKTKLHKYKWFRPVLIAVIAIGIIIWKFELVPNAFTSEPVVYAIGDDYQIVFTSRAKGTGWVKIGDKEYSDTYAGYRRTESTVHKITVPMSELDAAGEYTVYTRSMLLRGPYCALQGSTLSKEVSWRGVDTEDGLNYYAISDTHNDVRVPAKAAQYFGDKLDFLICCGDVVSWVDRTADLENALDLFGTITKGQVPVVYARGNHETKGEKADELYQYVVSENSKFYYTFRLKNVWGVVLDTGEDHEDDYIEYYGAAKFTDYRMEQVAFLDDILQNRDTEFDAPGIDYRIAVAHIPIAYKYKDDYAGAAKDEWIKRLNQMKLTMCFGGHVHELQYIDDSFEDGSTLTQCEEYSGKSEGNSSRYMTAAEFPEILVSRKSEGQQLTYPEAVTGTYFIGLAVSSDGEKTTMQYTNAEGKIIEDIISPWFSDIKYGDRIVVENIAD